MARKLSLGGMLSRTEAPPDGNGAPVDDQADDGTDGEPRACGRRAAAGEKVRGRKLQLPDSVFERLVFTRSNASRTPRRSLRRSSTATYPSTGSQPTTDPSAPPSWPPETAAEAPDRAAVISPVGPHADRIDDEAYFDPIPRFFPTCRCSRPIRVVWWQSSLSGDSSCSRFLLDDITPM